MGCYSDLDYAPFKTDLSREDFFKTLEEYKESLPPDVFDNFWYDFDVTPEGWVVIADEDLYGKHYGDRELAVFLSKVITLGERTSLTFEGEDGGRWGYAIEKDKVVELYYPEPLADGIPLDIYITNTQPKIDKIRLEYWVQDEFIQKDITGELIFKPDARFVMLVKAASRLIRQFAKSEHSTSLLQYIDIPGYYFWEELKIGEDTLRVEAPVCRVFVTSFMFRAYIRHTDIEIGTREVAFNEIFEK